MSIAFALDRKGSDEFEAVTGRPFAESVLLSDVVEAGWEVARSESAKGSEVAISRPFRSTDEATSLAKAVSVGDRTGLFRELTLERQSDAVRVRFRFSSRVEVTESVLAETPAELIPGADDDALEKTLGVDPHSDFRIELRLDLPGKTVGSNADRTEEGGVLVWEMTAGSGRELFAETEYLRTPEAVAVFIGLASLAALAILSVVGLVRRRRRAEGGRPGG